MRNGSKREDVKNLQARRKPVPETITDAEWREEIPFRSRRACVSAQWALSPPNFRLS
jgi:hypothetical protein